MQATAAIDRKIAARDGFALASSHFAGPNPDGPVVLINSGTAIPRQFYRHFAAYVASRGASKVITYDYRGISGSWPNGDRSFQYLMSDWARLDFPAMLDWIAENHPNKPLHVIGHSFGGQVLGLSGEITRIDKAITIAALSGHWRQMAAPERYRVFTMLYLAAPVLGRIYGYIPGKFGLGEDMGFAAFSQWAKWCANENYFFDDPNLPETKHFASLNCPLLVIGLDDDTWARPQLIDHLNDHFINADHTRWQFSPDDAGSPIGHFSFFKPKFEEKLWKPVVDWQFE